MKGLQFYEESIIYPSNDHTNKQLNDGKLQMSIWKETRCRRKQYSSVRHIEYTLWNNCYERKSLNDEREMAVKKDI